MRFNQKHTYILSFTAYLNAIANCKPGEFLADRFGQNVWCEVNRQTDGLLTKGPMLGKDIKDYFYNVVISHPGSGTRGGKDSGFKQTAGQHVSALLKAGILIKV